MDKKAEYSMKPFSDSIIHEAVKASDILAIGY